jgi:iron complex outermembrane receptor protein
MMSTRSSLTLAVTLLVATPLTYAADSARNEPDDRSFNQLDEVTVTAQRREQNLQEVPFAVTALDATMLERRQILSANQIRSSVPNLNYESGPGQATSSKIFYRGIGEDEALFTTDTPVGVYLDDVYIPRTTGSMFDLYGVERIEFLRGPQGTLYGRNTSAGALKIITRKPDETPSFSGQLRAGNYGRFDATLIGNVPLSDTVFAQVSALRRDQNGSTTNRLNGQKVNTQDVWAGRASVLFKPNDTFDALVVADRIRERSIAGWLIALTSGFEPGRADADGDGSIRTMNSDLFNPINNLDQQGLSATLAWRLPGVTLKSISAYRKMSNTLLIDIDGEGAPIPGSDVPKFHLFQDQHQDQFSQELQASGNAAGDRLQYVTGLYYFRESNDQHTTNLIFCTLATCDYTILGLTTDSVAAYGNLTYHVTDALSVTAGLRWTRDTKDFDLQLFSANGRAVTNTNGSAVRKILKKSWSDTTPRVAVDYKINHGSSTTMLYANVAKGFKSGSFDGRAADPVTIASLVPVAPETNWNYEAGFKSDLLDRRLRVNLNYYWAKFRDLQLGVARLNQPNTRFNAGDVRVTGVELEVTAVPLEGLEVTANVGTIDGKYTRIASDIIETCSNAFATPLTFDQLKRLKVREAPRFTGQLGVSYTVPVRRFAAAGGRVTAGANYARTGEHFHDFCNSRNIATQPFNLLNAQISYETEDGRWRFGIGGTNLTNATYTVQGFNVGPGPDHFIQSAVFAEPRKYVATVDFKFD